MFPKYDKLNQKQVYCFHQPYYVRKDCEDGFRGTAYELCYSGGSLVCMNSGEKVPYKHYTYNYGMDFIILAHSTPANLATESSYLIHVIQDGILVQTLQDTCEGLSSYRIKTVIDAYGNPLRIYNLFSLQRYLREIQKYDALCESARTEQDIFNKEHCKQRLCARWHKNHDVQNPFQEFGAHLYLLAKNDELAQYASHSAQKTEAYQQRLFAAKNILSKIKDADFAAAYFKWYSATAHEQREMMSLFSLARTVVREDENRIPVIVATNCQDTLTTLRQMTEGLPVKFMSLQEAGLTKTPPDNAETLEQKAIQTAAFYCAETELPVIAECGGLEIKSLYGFPGVYFEKLLGKEATKEERCHMIQCFAQKLPPNKRQASLVCVAAVAIPKKDAAAFRAVTEGVLAMLADTYPAADYTSLVLPQTPDRTQNSQAAGKKTLCFPQQQAFTQAVQYLTKSVGLM